MSEQGGGNYTTIEEIRKAAAFFDQLPGANDQLAEHLSTTFTEGTEQLVMSLLEYSRRYQSFHLSLIARAAHRLYEKHADATGKLRIDVKRGDAHAICMALHLSPYAGMNFYENLNYLVAQMPYTLHRLEDGDLTGDQLFALLGPLHAGDAEDREAFDANYRNNPTIFDSASVNECRDATTKFMLNRHDVDASEELAKARARRNVRFRKTKAGMSINAQVSPEVGVQVKKALDEMMNKAKHAGDERSEGQLRADLFVRAFTGTSDGVLPCQVLHVGLVMTDESLILGKPGTTFMPGYGDLPAEYAKNLIMEYEDLAALGPVTAEQEAGFAARAEALLKLRRLYVGPNGQDLVRMDSRERLFTGGLRQLVVLRDRYCRTPFCNNLVQDADHVRQASRGGATDADNSAMRCEPCNLAKEAAGWEEEVVCSGPHRIRVRPYPGVGFESLSPPLRGLWRRPGAGFDVLGLQFPVAREGRTLPLDE